ncbi:MAG: CcdB family protein [Myxococcaceae bacterium]|nr:CcdB family protein [Myxococcaceae bacterium]
MGQLDVYRNPNTRSRREVPWLVDLQHPLLSGLSTRMMAPLVRPATIGRAALSRLNPRFTVDGEAVVMLTQLLGSVRATALTRPVANLNGSRAAILSALDMLWSGV